MSPCAHTCRDHGPYVYGGTKEGAASGRTRLAHVEWRNNIFNACTKKVLFMYSNIIMCKSKNPLFDTLSPLPVPSLSNMAA